MSVEKRQIESYLTLFKLKCGLNSSTDLASTLSLSNEAIDKLTTKCNDMPSMEIEYDEFLHSVAKSFKEVPIWNNCS